MSTDGENGQRTVLMLCYHFPPVSSAGTQRNVGFARLLPQFGWKPIVMTVRSARNRFERTGEPAPGDVEVVRTYEWNLHSCLVLATGILNRLCDLVRARRRSSVFFQWCLPDPQIAWLTTARAAVMARRYSRIYASCAPFSAALSACVLKKLTQRPVILDFRDAWALNPHGNYTNRQRRVLRYMERWVVRNCDALILNTLGAERAYRSQYPEHAHKMTCIPNGFDRLNVPDAIAHTARFTIMHVGDFYRSRSPERLLEALVRIDNPAIEFVQVGPVFDCYERFKDRLAIRLIDRVPNAEALRLMQSASLLFLCQGREVGIADYIAVASKTYEYLATGLPILADCPAGDNADVVRKYASRSWVITSSEVADIESAVRQAYEERLNAKAEVSPAFIETFSRERLSSLLAHVFDSVVPEAKGLQQASPPDTYSSR